MRVALLSEGSDQVGAGHVMRTLVLGEALEDRGCEVSFAGECTLPWLSNILARWASVSLEDRIARANIDAVVIDSYTITQARVDSLKSEGISVVLIADDATPSLNVDICILPCVDSSWAPPLGASESFTVRGVDYLLIRADIRESKLGNASGRSAGGRLLVTLGGAASASGILRVVDAAVQAGWRGGIDAITTARDLVEELPIRRNLELYEPGPALLPLAEAASFVVSAAGVTSWEMLALGKPLCIFKTAANQVQNYEYQTTHGLSWGLGDVRDPISVESFAAVMTDRSLRDSMALRAATAVDGLGGQRGADIIMARLARR
jgi:spore coat polysaccharide biosynthesis predicted glycosyltransferase SpsG